MLKKDVLREKKDFSAIYNRGKSVGDRYLILFFRKNNLSYNRTGFLASKKVGNSVKRNRARRLLKESYRNYCEKLPTGYDFVFVARNNIEGQKQENVGKSMFSAFVRAGVLNKNEVCK